MELPQPIRGSEWGGSRYSLFQTCHMKHYWSHEFEGTGLVPIADSYAASRGTIVHLGIQAFYALPIVDPVQYGSMTYADRAIAAILYAIQHLETLNIPAERLALMKDEVIAALDQYFQKYEFELLDVIDVEAPIEFTIDGNKYTGIRDMMAVWKAHKVVVDHKTTGLGWDQFFKKWKFDLSLKGYAYEAWKRTGELHHIMINAVRFTRKKSLDVELEREVIFLKESDMLEFEQTIKHINSEIAICRDSGFWPKSGHQCVQVYGVCAYRDLCDFPDPSMVKTFYKHRGAATIPVEANHE